MGLYENLTTSLHIAARRNPRFQTTWSYPWPRVGPEGQPLRTYVHKIGARRPRAAYAVTYAEHPAEAKVGAAAQRQLATLDTDEVFGPESALYLIGPVCPENLDEDRTDSVNIDGNRSCGPTYTTRFNYDAFKQYVHPPMINAESRVALRELMQTRRIEARQALVGGQHHDRYGISYGGQECESAAAANMRRIFLDIREDGSERLATGHKHSGLGLRDQISLVSLTPDPKMVELIKRLINDDRIQFSGIGEAGVACEIYGTYPQMIEALLSPSIEVMALTLEIGGDSSPETNLPRIIERNWIKHHPGILPPEEELAIIQRFKSIFYLAEPEWLQRYLRESMELALRVGRYLRQSP